MAVDSHPNLRDILRDRLGGINIKALRAWMGAHPHSLDSKAHCVHHGRSGHVPVFPDSAHVACQTC